MATINVNPGNNPFQGSNMSRYLIMGFIGFILFMLLTNTTFIWARISRCDALG
jgi:hypothetical protein